MPLRYLFVDMDSFFASVEQQHDPRLRGRPVAVVPVMARSTCCIAASREAKELGVKTGTPVWEALQLTDRKIRLVLADHEKYVGVHKTMLDAVGRCVPVDEVKSIDEVSCKLIGDEREPAAAARIAGRIKAELKAAVGECVTCSVGVGPNKLLAKVASDMQKPNGLTVIRPDDLPGCLHRLKLTDFPGIGPRMEKRLRRFGVLRVSQLCAMSAAALSEVWGSKIHGGRWHDWLRGHDAYEKPTKTRAVTHSHVLPPELRTDAGARGVLVRLFHKAAARLRDMGYWAGAVSVGLRYEDGRRWTANCRVPHCQDTRILLEAFAALWARRPAAGEPKQVQMGLWELLPSRSATPSLFAPADGLCEVMDRVNRALGRHSVYFGTLHATRHTAPTRIAFTRVPEFDPAFA